MYENGKNTKRQKNVIFKNIFHSACEEPRKLCWWWWLTGGRSATPCSKVRGRPAKPNHLAKPNLTEIKKIHNEKPNHPTKPSHCNKLNHLAKPNPTEIKKKLMKTPIILPNQAIVTN
jgi:hypothetical protein